MVLLLAKNSIETWNQCARNYECTQFVKICIDRILLYVRTIFKHGQSDYYRYCTCKCRNVVLSRCVFITILTVENFSCRGIYDSSVARIWNRKVIPWHPRGANEKTAPPLQISPQMNCSLYTKRNARKSSLMTAIPSKTSSAWSVDWYCLFAVMCETVPVQIWRWIHCL